MLNNMVSININIPNDKKEIIKAFNALINAFKNDIEVRKEEDKIEYSLPTKYDLVDTKTTRYEEAKAKFFSQYVGAFKISDNAEEEYNQYRINKYGK